MPSNLVHRFRSAGSETPFCIQLLTVVTPNAAMGRDSYTRLAATGRHSHSVYEETPI